MANKSEDALNWVMAPLAMIAIIVGLGIFAWQILTWLKIGYWVAVPLSDGLEYIGIDLSSIYFPIGWRGVMKILQWFLGWPLSLCVPIIVVPVIYIPALIATAIVCDTKEFLQNRKNAKKKIIP